MQAHNVGNALSTLARLPLCHKPLANLGVVAGTTGLEPATSAVTVIPPTLTYRKQKHGRLRKALKSIEKHPKTTPQHPRQHPQGSGEDLGFSRQKHKIPLFRASRDLCRSGARRSRDSKTDRQRSELFSVSRAPDRQRSERCISSCLRHVSPSIHLTLKITRFLGFSLLRGCWRGC